MPPTAPELWSYAAGPARNRDADDVSHEVRPPIRGDRVGNGRDATLTAFALKP